MERKALRFRALCRFDSFLLIVNLNAIKMAQLLTECNTRVLSYRCVLHYFLTMPVGFNFNLTFGLKPQVSGIKIVTVYKRSIFQDEWLIATLIK